MNRLGETSAWILSLVVWCSAGRLYGEEAWEAELKTLSAQIQSLKEKMPTTDVQDRLNKVEALLNEIRTVAKPVVPNVSPANAGPDLVPPANSNVSGAVQSGSADSDTLERKVNLLDANLKNAVSSMEKRFEGIDRTLESVALSFKGRAFPNILENMARDTPDGDKFHDTPSSFKDHFMRSVQGYLVVKNGTDYEFFITVNGVEYRVPPPSNAEPEPTVAILVPFGIVRTQLFWQRDQPAGIPINWGEETGSKSQWKLDSHGKTTRLILPIKIVR